MPVECYALVEFKRHLTEEEKKYQPTDEEIEYGEAYISTKVYNLCHLRLVQPVGKNGSSPTPKWEVVEQLEGLEYKVYPSGGQSQAIKDFCTYRGYKLLNNKSVYLTIIHNRRIQKWQIVQLFSECKSMPMWLALDYVRNLI